MKRLYLLTVFCLAFSGCSIFTAESSLSPELVEDKSASSVSRFISKTALSRVFSKELYRVKAFLPEPDSYVSLFSHFSGFDLEDGVKVQAAREAFKLNIKASVQGGPSRLLFSEENYFSSNQNEIDLSIEVSNGLNYGVRIRVWENFVNRTGAVKKPIEVLSEENLKADSLSQNITFYEQGRGLKWGIKLFRSHFIEGARVSPQTL